MIGIIFNNKYAIAVKENERDIAANFRNNQSKVNLRNTLKIIYNTYKYYQKIAMFKIYIDNILYESLSIEPIYVKR